MNILKLTAVFSLICLYLCEATAEPVDSFDFNLKYGKEVQPDYLWETYHQEFLATGFDFEMLDAIGLERLRRLQEELKDQIPRLHDAIHYYDLLKQLEEMHHRKVRDMIRRSTHSGISNSSSHTDALLVDRSAYWRQLAILHLNLQTDGAPFAYEDIKRWATRAPVEAFDAGISTQDTQTLFETLLNTAASEMDLAAVTKWALYTIQNRKSEQSAELELQGLKSLAQQLEGSLDELLIHVFKFYGLDLQASKTFQPVEAMILILQRKEELQGQIQSTWILEVDRSKPLPVISKNAEFESHVYQERANLVREFMRLNELYNIAKAFYRGSHLENCY